jgi:hypothetical protein
MRLLKSRIEKLPSLAWLAEVDSERGEVALLHGRWVEVRDGFFIEGVWDGPFSEGSFHRTANVFGSGGIVTPDGIVFVSSGCTTDYLYYRNDKEKLVVSNSLPFLLAHTKDELDPRNTSYTHGCDSIVDGIDKYQPEIPTRGGVVQRLLFRNLVYENGRLRLDDKPLCAPFGQFADYAGFVRDRYANIVLNARDPDRTREFKILSTQSKGYDSTAVNAFAAKFGIDTAFTVTQSKGSGAFAENDAGLQGDDDGTEIANRLGFKCVSLDRRRFQEELEDEYLYFAGIANCEDLNFSGITPHIDSPSILLTGTLGELYYPATYYAGRFPGEKVGTDLRRGDLSGHGLTEVRLAAGFIQLPLIYVGAQQRESITRITESKEMDPWRLNNAYDRPIPRRIAEEAGVPRAWFGQKKMATAISYARPNIPQGSRLRKEFFTFLVAEGLLKSWKIRLFGWVHRYNALVWFASPRKYSWMYYLSRARLKMTGKGLSPIWKDLDSSLYCYSVNKRVRDYIH